MSTQHKHVAGGDDNGKPKHAEVATWPGSKFDIPLLTPLVCRKIKERLSEFNKLRTYTLTHDMVWLWHGLLLNGVLVSLPILISCCLYPLAHSHTAAKTLAQLEPASEKLGGISQHELPAWWKPCHDTILALGVGLYGLDAEKIIDKWSSSFDSAFTHAVCV